MRYVMIRRLVLIMGGALVASAAGFAALGNL